MTEDTFCCFCLVIANKYSERAIAKLEEREEDFVRKNAALRKMIEKFKREIKDEV